MGQIKNIKLHIVTDIKSAMHYLLVILLIYYAHGKPTIPDSEPSNKTNADCHPNNWDVLWTKGNGVWYTPVNKPYNWYDMNTVCRNIEKGRTTLATVISSAEQRKLAQLLKTMDVSSAWTGGVRVASKLWFWYKDTGVKKTMDEVKYSYWSGGNPSDSRGHKDCIHICNGEYGHVGGAWNDLTCTYERPGVCELRC